MLPTSYRYLTDTSPTVGQQSVVCRPTGSLYLGRPTDGRQSADSFFRGAPLHNYRGSLYLELFLEPKDPDSVAFKHHLAVL